MSKRVTINAKNQITVPPEISRQLGIKPGDVLLIEVRDGLIYLLPEPRDWVESTRGLHHEVWEGIDPVEYVRAERGSCPTS